MTTLIKLGNKQYDCNNFAQFLKSKMFDAESLKSRIKTVIQQGGNKALVHGAWLTVDQGKEVYRIMKRM